MSDELRDPQEQDESSNELSRRDFVAMSIAAGIAAAAGGASAAELPVVETDVDIKTPDGVCNAAFIHPEPARIRASSSGRTPSVSGPLCASWASGWPRKATPCSCQIRSIA